MAPILLFTYKRLETLKNTIAALKDNELACLSDLHIFSDGPKTDKDVEIINQIREYLSNIDGFRSISIYESKTNKGLANSIINGVNSIMKENDRVIVLEDDLLTTPNFLSYMNQALDYYETSENVFSISGYSFDLEENEENPNFTYFLNRGWSWGWATWKDRWTGVDWNVSDYSDFSKNRNLQKAFAKGGSDLNKMLRKQMNGQLDSWAIRWFYHQFKINGLTLYPIGSKIYNDGFDQHATHTNGSDKRYIPNLDTVHSTNFNFPKEVCLDEKYQKRFQTKMGILARFKSKLETILKL